MLAYAAMMTGQRDLAMKHIRAMVAEMPADFLKENAMQAEGNVAMPLEVMVRFGLWDEILAEPENTLTRCGSPAHFIMPLARSRMPRKATRLTRAKLKVFLSNAPSLCQRTIL
jgi:hypothetical protein